MYSIFVPGKACYNRFTSCITIIVALFEYVAGQSSERKEKKAAEAPSNDAAQAQPHT